MWKYTDAAATGAVPLSPTAGRCDERNPINVWTITNTQCSENLGLKISFSIFFHQFSLPRVPKEFPCVLFCIWYCCDVNMKWRISVVHLAISDWICAIYIKCIWWITTGGRRSNCVSRMYMFLYCITHCFFHRVQVLPPKLESNRILTGIKSLPKSYSYPGLWTFTVIK